MANEDAGPYADVNDDGSVGGLSASFVEVDGVEPRVDGIRTRYYERGGGDPMVLIHGGNWGGTASANTWSTVFDGLADHFRVLAPDRLGCGMTDNPDHEDDYVYGAELEHMLSFLDTVAGEAVHMVGQSRGGGLAGRIAAEVPDRVHTLTVVNSATLAPPAGDHEFRRARVFRDAPTDESDPEFHARQFEHMYSLHEYSAHHVTDEFVRTAGYMRTRPKARKTAEVMEERDGQQRWEATLQDHMEETRRRMKNGDVGMPTLLYWGRNDPSIPLTGAVSLYDVVGKENARVELSVHNKAGHHPYREYPERFVHELVSFVGFWEEHGYDYGTPDTRPNG